MVDAERFPNPEAEELSPAQSMLISLTDEIMAPAPANVGHSEMHLRTSPAEIENRLRSTVFGHMILRTGRSLAEPGSEGEVAYPDLVVSPENLLIARLTAHRRETVTYTGEQRDPRKWVRDAGIGLWYRHHEDPIGGIEVRVRSRGEEGVSNKSITVSRSVYGPITVADSTYHSNLTVEHSADEDIANLLDYMRSLFDRTIAANPPKAL